MTQNNERVVPGDPLSSIGLEGFVQAFRAGTVTSEQVTRAYLDRIEALDGKLGAFQHVAAESAIATARAMDALRESGVWLGPLMGVPIGIKDIFVIDGMPGPKVGSRMELPRAAGEVEGPFIQALRRAGCVFLGQTKAVELCLGITGVSAPLGTPWNPYNLEQQHIPGGSSSGSAVATAAGMCAFAIGSDTGGSVRVPAAYNGLFGLKTSWGLWPLEGTFPLEPNTDTIGLLTRTADDAILVHETITGTLTGAKYPRRVPSPELDRLRIGIPDDLFLDDLSPQVQEAFSSALALLRERGVRLDSVAMPEVKEREGYFPIAIPAAIIATLGEENFERQKHLMDPIIRKRVETGLNVKAHVVLAAEARRQRSIAAVRDRFEGFDAWVSPTAVSAAPALSEFDDPDNAMALAMGMSRNTQPGNYLEFCSVSVPIPQPAGQLPLGLQLMAPACYEDQLLAVAREIEEVLGRQLPPQL
ncbi:MAG: amidase [Burkholderiaceae bacterium]